MLCDYFSKVLCISLPESKKRQDNIFKQFSQSKLNECLKIFPAVNGKNIDIRLLSDTVVTENGMNDITNRKIKHFGITLSYGALGCALSHYLIYQECKDNIKPYLILEDDIEIIDNFDAQLENLVETIGSIEYDIVYLGLHNIPSLNKTHKISDMLYKPSGMTCGTYAMIVSNNGAQKLLDIVFPITVQIDSEISNNKKYLNVYATNTELVKHSHRFGSYVQRDNGFINNIQEMIL